MNLDFHSRSEIQALLGARLRDQRLAQNLAQTRLAGMAGVSLGALRNLENEGRCTLETWIAVVQALGLVGELETLFVFEPRSIAHMKRAEVVGRRRRASRQKS